MADISSISGLSSLSEDLYYQYLINNNSTSTMLNALSGDTSEDSGSGNLLNAVTSRLTSSGLSSLNGLESLLGSGDDLLSASQGVSNFSSILETYLNAQNAEAVQMSEKLSEVLEEAAQTEDTSSLTYQTVQEIYQYFMDKTSASSAAEVVRGGSSAEQSQVETGTAVTSTDATEMDFDALERQIQEEVEAALPYGFSF